MTSIGLPRPRGVAGITAVQGVALAVPFLFVARIDAGQYAVLFGAMMLTALTWEVVFAGLRGRRPSFHGVTTALVVAIIAPSDAAVSQLVVVMSLGVIFGELVFGGRGFGFLSPAAVVLSLFVISAPDVSLAVPTRELALATLPGGMLLFALGLISGPVILATLGAAVVVLALAGQGFDPLAIATGLGFGLVFLIADPTAAAATRAGRWIYGAMAGGLGGCFPWRG